MELAGNIRGRIAYVLREGVTNLDIITSSDAYFYIQDGRLYTVHPVSPRQSVTIETTPDEMPLEKYDVHQLLEISKRIGAE